MKDAYSFHDSKEDLENYYQKNVYCITTYFRALNEKILLLLNQTVE